MSRLPVILVLRLVPDRGSGAPQSRLPGEPQEVCRLGDRSVAGLEPPDPGKAKPASGPVEERDVDPERLERRPPTQTRGPAPITEEGERLRLGDLA